jgi:hypothetical protein
LLPLNQSLPRLSSSIGRPVLDNLAPVFHFLGSTHYALPRSALSSRIAVADRAPKWQATTLAVEDSQGRRIHRATKKYALRRSGGQDEKCQAPPECVFPYWCSALTKSWNPIHCASAMLLDKGLWFAAPAWARAASLGACNERVALRSDRPFAGRKLDGASGKKFEKILSSSVG